MQKRGQLYIYHEKQDAGLCAVHCLNALLQGQVFNEIDLAEIAHKFDDDEKKMMMELGTDDPNFLKYMAEDSGNLADDGNYSIQVITKALEVMGLMATPLSNPSMIESRMNPLNEEAFICNMQSHWLAIRKIYGKYYNLNSLLSAPQVLSDFYLSAFLDTLQGQGYTVFVVRGNLHQPIFESHNAMDKNWVKIQDEKENDQNEGTLSDEERQQMEDMDIEAAIAASLAAPTTTDSNKDKPILIEQDEDEEAELQAAIELSRQQGGAPTPVYTVVDEPPKGEGVTEIAFKLPDGNRTLRRFHFTEKVDPLFQFLNTKGLRNAVLRGSFPPRTFERGDQTSLEVAGLTPNANLFVQEK